MKFQLRKCEKCQIFTLKEICDSCKVKTLSAHPAKYSPDDRYLRYRIREKNNF